MTLSTERKGEMLILLETAIFALTPIMLSSAGGNLPPFFYYAITSLLSCFLFVLILRLRKKNIFAIPKHLFLHAFLGTFFIGLLLWPTLFFLGQKVVAGSQGILLQAELFFSFLFFGVILGTEKITWNRLLGASTILCGVLLVLFRDISWANFSIWELAFAMIMCLAPVGNYFQQKVTKQISSLQYLVFRSLLVVLVFFPLSFFWEELHWGLLQNPNNLFLIAINGFLVFAISRILWLETIKRIDVSKANSINAIVPALALLYAFLLLQEIPTWEQTLGVLLTFVGTFFLFEKRAR